MKITQEAISKIIDVNKLLRKEFAGRQWVEFGLCDNAGFEVTVGQGRSTVYHSVPSSVMEKEVSEIFDYIVGVV